MKEPKGFFQSIPAGHLVGHFLKVLTMGLLGKCPLAPSVKASWTMSAANLCDTVAIDKESEFGLQIALGLWGLQLCVNSSRVGGECIGAEGSHHKALAWPRDHKG